MSVDEINGRVTTRMLYRAIDDTKETLRAEQAAIRTDIARLDSSVQTICKRLDARPAKTWLAGRTTAVIDRLTPLGLVGVITWILTH